MKFEKKASPRSAEGDMTPMIDMTFQLIAFFMVLINFSEAEMNQAIRLPSSELAKPADEPPESSLVLQLTDRGTVLYAGDELPISELKEPLQREWQVMNRGGKNAAEATIIIRADLAAKTGQVQELVKAAQDQGFENFALRAKQKIEGQ